MLRSTYARRRAEKLQLRDFAGAGAVGAEYLAAHPGDAQACHEQSWVLQGLRNWSEAQHWAREAVRLAPHRRDYALALERVSAHIAEREADYNRVHRQYDEQSRRSILERLNSAFAFVKSRSARYSAQSPRYWHIATDYPFDDYPGWTLDVPISAAEGDVVDFGILGKYRAGNPNHVIQKRLTRGIPWDAPLVSFMMELCRPLTSADAVIDVGANIGTISVPIGINSDAYSIAVEPDEINYRDLLENISLNKECKLRPVNVACGSARGRGRMFHPDSLNPGQAKMVVDSTGDVQIATLDSLCSGHTLALIKLDVEGGEESVIAGGRDIILRDSPVIITEILAGARTREVLEALGYEGMRLWRSDWVFCKLT